VRVDGSRGRTQTVGHDVHRCGRQAGQATSAPWNLEAQLTADLPAELTMREITVLVHG